jgi:hypothetical protein
VAVHDFDHELEERLQIVDDLFGMSLLGERGEVSDVEKHHADVLLLAPHAGATFEELTHDHRRDMLPEGVDDIVSLLGELE